MLSVCMNLSLSVANGVTALYSTIKSTIITLRIANCVLRAAIDVTGVIYYVFNKHIFENFTNFLKPFFLSEC